MSDWGWVTFAYGVAYGSLAMYATSIALRIRTTRRDIGDNE